MFEVRTSSNSNSNFVTSLLVNLVFWKETTFPKARQALEQERGFSWFLNDDSDASAAILHQLHSHVLAISMATGNNMCVQAKLEYFILCCAAWSAATPAMTVLANGYVGLCVPVW